MKNTSCFVNLRIVGKGLKLQEITDKIGITPDTSYKEDEERITNVLRREERVIYKEDGWIASVETKHNKRHEPIESIENAIDRFMKILCPATDYIRELSTKAEITFWIDGYPDSEQQNVHISKEVLKNLFDMGITLDCSMAFLKPFYDGTYERNRKE